MKNLIHLGSRMFVDSSQIMMIKADTNYSFIYLLDGRCLYSSTTLGKLQKRLHALGNFTRVHASYLINDNILAYSAAGKYEITEKLTFLVSRRKAKK